MRRSARLIDKFAVKRKANDDVHHVKAPDRPKSSSHQATPRRGLFQDTPEVSIQEEFEVEGDYRIFVGAVDRPLPPSPFLAPDHMASLTDLPPPPPPYNDENTPPPKRRHVENPSEEPHAEGSIEDDFAVMTDQDQDQPVVPSPEGPTWFTPIRRSRPPLPPGAIPASQRGPAATPPQPSSNTFSRMPSFSQWMETEDSKEQPAAAEEQDTKTVAQETQTPCKGVDMTDLAMLYDPQVASCFTSPPTPVEKILQRGAPSPLN